MGNLARATMLFVLASSFAVACGSDDPPTRSVGDGCYVASDCPSPLVCAFQRCHSQCLTSRDCPVGQICVGSAYPRLGICLLPEESTCTRHSDCPEPLVCGRRNKCEDACRTDRDCLTGQICAQGSCADPAEAPADGMQIPGNEADTCIHNSDCNAPLVCKNGQCAYECITTRDCPSGLLCAADRTCRTTLTVPDSGTDGTTDATLPPGWGAGCSFNSDCTGTLICRSGRCDFECRASSDCPKSYVCVSNVCFAGPSDASFPDTSSTDASSDAKPCTSNDQCDDGKWCNGVELCSLGRCAPAVEGPCSSHSSCVIDECTETDKTCKHTKVAGTDVDGDGQLDLVCGGTDCDDGDPKTYGGAPERCDGKDNSCNGVIDDYAVLPRGTTMVSAPTAAKVNGGGAMIGTDKFVAFASVDGICGVSAPAKATMQLVTSAGAGTEKQVATGPCTGMRLVGAAGGPGAAVLAFDNPARMAVIVKEDGTVVSTVTLAPAPGSTIQHAADVDPTWMGTQWLVGFTRSIAIGSAGAVEHYGKFGFLKPDGAVDIRNVPTADGKGQLGGGAQVRVAFNATTLGVAWSNAAGKVDFAVLDTSGAVVSGPITISAMTGNPIAMAGTSLGYALLYNDPAGTRYAFISNAGVKGADKAAGIATGRNGHGTFDASQGEGAMAVESNDGLTLVYARKDLAAGVEHTVAFTPTAPASTDAVSIDFFGGTLGLTHFASSDDKVRFVRAGCLP
jgi:hypothetical protein